MSCPFCGVAFNIALDAGAGTVAGTYASHIRAQHPKEAFVVSVIGGTVLLYVISRIFK